MQIIVITRPDFFEGETAIVERLFAKGMQRLHLRKPGATREQMAKWLSEVDAAWRGRIVVHDHHDLAQEFSLGGIHLNSRNPEVPEWFDCNRFTLSRSCHTLPELAQFRQTCDYLFLSPIFDSISKEGYRAAFSTEDLAEARAKGLLADKVYALGGVSFDKLPILEALGFAGAAMLGAVWNDQNRPFCSL